MKTRYNLILVIIILIGLCCASWLTYERHQVEKQNNTVELAMDFESIRRMAKWEGYETKDLLKAFKVAGLTTLVVYDTTLERMSERQEIVAVSGMDLLREKHSGGNGGIFSPLLTTGSVITDAIYIASQGNAEGFQEMSSDSNNRYGKERVSVIDGECVM